MISKVYFNIDCNVRDWIARFLFLLILARWRRIAKDVGVIGMQSLCRKFWEISVFSFYLGGCFAKLSTSNWDFYGFRRLGLFK